MSVNHANNNFNNQAQNIPGTMGASGASSNNQLQKQMFSGSNAAVGNATGNLTGADRQKKYNTIDTANVQNNMSGAAQAQNVVSQSPGISAGGMGAGPSPHVQQTGAHPAGTQETAGTTNPSNDLQSNNEFIDIMRKIPRILCERYELLDVLGKGAHGRIYLAIDLVTHDKVAIKLMEKSSKNKSKFQREISLMKDMMKLAKRKPLKENCIKYQDPETVQLNAKIQQQQMQKNNGQPVTANRNRRIGFPRLYSYCSDQNYYYLVMQLLGVNLKELKESFKECKFSIQTTVLTALQLMNRLASIHSQGYIHRDLKPANVVIGNDTSEAHFIYLIDFGLAKKESSTNPVPEAAGKAGKAGGGGDDSVENVIDPKTGKKKTASMTLKEYMLDEKDNFRVVGTAMYAALAAHLPNKKYLKKDDIESLLFLLSYFGVGQLPWRYKTNQEGLEKMMHYKYEIKPKELFPPSVFPPQFAKLFEYIRYIPDDQEADYAYIERELLQAAQSTKIDPSLLIPLDWMNGRPIIQQSALSHPKAQSPQPQQKGNRHTVNSQLSKNANNGNNIPNGIKTPLISDKNKKQQFAMTPDIHTKTYAERSGLGGIASGLSAHGMSNMGVGNQANVPGYNPSLHSSAKNQKGQQQNNIMGMTVGGSGINTNSMIGGINATAQGTNNSNLGMYPGVINTDNDLKGAGVNEFDNLGEDLIMMNIPREGNADHLNKSTKLTLSSKKQYDNHLQNIPLQQHMNNGQNQQYMLQVSGQGATSAGMTALNNINAVALNATRSKMNSTMMVKFNSSTEKSMNQRGNLNKSTLLPNNMPSNNAHLSTINNSRNPNMKMNLNIDGTTGQASGNGQLLDHNLQQNSLDHLNRSLNMHQMSMAFSNNQSYQQSPPNIRNNKNMMMHQPSHGLNQANMNHGQMQQQLNTMQSTHHKLNNLFDKNKTSNINIKVSGGVNTVTNQSKNQQANNGLFIGSNHQHLQTINANSQNQNNSLLLPHAPGAMGGGSNTKSTWNTQAMSNTIVHGPTSSQKNKDRYMQIQQQNRGDQNPLGQNSNSQNQNKQQFYVGSASSNMNNLNNSQLAHNAAGNMNMNSVDIQQMQNQVNLMHQSPTLSPTNGFNQQNQGATNPQYIYGTAQSTTNQGLAIQHHTGQKPSQHSGGYTQQYKSIKIMNAQQQQYKSTQNKSSQPTGGNQSQFGSRLSHNTNVSGNNTQSQMKKNSTGNINTGNSVLQSPIKTQQNINQIQQNTSMLQQQRQSKNSSALGIIGGSIVSNNQSQSTPVEAQGGANPFVRQGQAMNKTGMMYNTMYGGVGHNGASSQQSQSQNGAANGNTPGTKTNGQNQPIHIKIEDQTGIVGGPNKGGIVSNTNPQTTKKQFQQTTQKFGTNAIKGQHGVNTGGTMTTKGKNGATSSNNNSMQQNFSRKKSKVGLSSNNGTNSGLGSQSNKNKNLTLQQKSQTLQYY